MRSKTSFVAFLACFGALVANARTATAGDFEAHSKAAVEAVRVVAAEAEFKNGVGSPKFQLFSDSHPPGQEAKDPVNWPDEWSCFDAEQPQALTDINKAIDPLGDSIPDWVGSIGHCPLAMACNYSHFNDNPVDARMPNTKRSFEITRDWAREITDRIGLLATQGPDASSYSHFASHDGYCDVDTWHLYWRRVLAASHYIQDAECEDHVLGNMICSAKNPLMAAIPVGRPWRFAHLWPCLGWIGDRITLMAVGCTTKRPSCDDEVYSKAAGCYVPSDRTLAIVAGCDGMIPAMCMGFERLIWHHCNGDSAPKPTPKSFTCDGPRRDNCSAGKTGYCEGEVCPNCDAPYCPGKGGENFVYKAKKVTIPVLEDMARKWAEICKEPTVCTPDECQAWCRKSTATPDPANSPIRGDCVGTGSACACNCTQTTADDTRPPQSCGADAGVAEKDAAPPSGVDCSRCAPTDFNKRFDRPNYLIHATGHGTLEGPVKDDVYMLYIEPPDAKGVFRLPDGSGGTYTYSSDYHSGALNSPNDVCNAAAARGLKPQEWSPYNRTLTFDCKCMSCSTTGPSTGR